MSSIDQIAGVKRKELKLSRAGEQAIKEAGVPHPTGHDLATMPSIVQISEAMRTEPVAPEKKCSFTVSPILRSFDMTTADDMETAVERLVGGEVKITIRF